MKYATHEDFVQEALTNGIPSPELPLSVRQAYVAANYPVPGNRLNPVIVTPPPSGSGRCGHCGETIEPGTNTRAHAVAGFEHARNSDGDPLRMLIDHCDACLDSAACDPGQTTPGSGHPEGSPAGFCEEVSS